MLQEGYDCDAYLMERAGTYDNRAVRYRAAADKLFEQGLNNSHTLCDIGAGWTELDYCLRKEYDWRGRYNPIDVGLDGNDLEFWKPVREVDFYVCLEILEHLHNPQRLLNELMNNCSKGIVCSVPNPDTVDVLGIDPTHYTIITQEFFEQNGFSSEVRTFYGGFYSDGDPDAIFAYWFKD